MGVPAVVRQSALLDSAFADKAAVHRLKSISQELSLVQASA